MDSEAIVIEAADGDTLDVEINGSGETVRLIGVDTPETRGGTSPGEFDLPDTEGSRNCLEKYARLASERAAALKGERIRVRQDSRQDKEGGYGRTLAYIYVNGSERSFNRRLVEEGLGRVYVSDFEELDSFMEAQREAREQRRGVWGCVSQS
jgi:micrococcal nuclease